MIRASSGVQIQKLQTPLQQISPFNSAIRYSNPYSDAPSTPQRSFFNQQIRSSATITPNKIQYGLKENNGSIEARIQSLVNENMYLNQELEKSRLECQNFQQQNDQLNYIKAKMLQLENQVENQVNEIEEWKLKYQKVSSKEQVHELALMENQVISVIQENERLNLLSQQMAKQLAEKEQEIKQLIGTINRQENEIKKSREKIISQGNNKATPLNAWNLDKKLQKVMSSTNDLKQSKCKVVGELEMNRKKSDYMTQKQTTKNLADLKELNELQAQVINLQNDKSQLIEKIDILEKQNKELQHQTQPKNQDQPDNQCAILKQEISNQQILITEEFKKYKAQQQANTQLREQAKKLEEFLRDFVSNLNEDSVIDTTMEEFSSSQMNCLQIIEKLQQQ